VKQWISRQHAAQTTSKRAQLCSQYLLAAWRSGMADSPQESHHKNPLAISAAVGVVVIVFVLTWTTALRRPFVDDDWHYLNVVQQTGWWHSSTVWNPRNGLYRPVLYLWIGALHSVFDLHPLAYHLATLAVVLIVGFLTYRVAMASGLNRGGRSSPVRSSSSMPRSDIPSLGPPLRPVRYRLHWPWGRCSSS
jgi:hypothetical protein